MKNRVNLFQDEFRPKLELVSLGFVCAVWVGVLLIGMLFYGLASQKNNQVNSNLKNVERELAAKVNLSKQLSLELENRKPSKELLDKITFLKKQIQVKDRVYSKLGGQKSLATTGYSSLMLDLAKQNQKGLWLTRINIDGPLIVLEGGADNSQVVPTWVDSLDSSSFLSGKEFAEARIYRDDDEQLQFVLNSQLDESLLDVSNGGSDGK